MNYYRFHDNYNRRYIINQSIMTVNSAKKGKEGSHLVNWTNKWSSRYKWSRWSAIVFL